MTRGARRRTSHTRTITSVIAATLLALALVTGVSVTLLYRHLNGNLEVVPIPPGQNPDRPPKVDVEGPHEQLNILVMGSDSREGAGNDIDGATGGGSDTTILFHLSADRTSAYGISIPRDSLVDRPDCYTAEGETIPGQRDAIWNAAFSLGGPACTERQLEQVTGVHVDNYVVVDFSGFEDMVDAVGGVEVCVPEDLDSDKGHIHIAQGVHNLEGQAALDYIRIRYGVGDGTDLGRIRRQQAFIASLADKVISSDTLARPGRLLGFLDAATRSLTTDIPNIRELADIGLQLNGIGRQRIRFLTVPNELSTEQPGRVEWLPEAQALWERIRVDKPLGSLRDGSIGVGDVGVTAPPSAGTATPTGTPSSSEPGPSGHVGADPHELENAGLCT
jgi:LCP family protein required for cell wall assembly